MDNRRIALITGGNSGIGRASSEVLAEDYDVVIITGRDAEKGNSIANDLCNNGKEVHFFKADITSKEDVDSLATKIKNEYGRLDCLVNNAGIYPKFNPLDALEKDEWNNVFETNTTGLMYVTKKMFPMLKERKGNIVNIASVAGIQGFASGQGYAYAASKSAVIQFTKMIAKNYAKEVRINCVCPGVIDTPLYFSLDKEKMSSRIPAGRVGDAMEVAKVVRFLASDEASYIYGATITVDGGLTL